MKTIHALKIAAMVPLAFMVLNMLIFGIGESIGSDTGKPIVASHPDSPVAKALTEITQKIGAKVSVAALGAKNDIPINIV